MAVTTGRYMWGWRVRAGVNQTLDFMCDEAGHTGDPFTATLRVGAYTAGQFATEVARAMTAAHSGAGDAFTCVFDFSTRKFTIDNGSRNLTLRFDLNTATNCAGLLGFDDVTTGSASGHTSTDTVGVTNSFFNTAGVKSWAPSDPAVMNTPITAAADGSTATRLQRHPRAVQQETDGGQRETIYFSTDKLFRIQYRMLSQAEQLNFDALMDWLETGAPVDFRPDDTAASNINCRFVLASPGDTPYTFSWLTRTESDAPELVLLQQLERT